MSRQVLYAVLLGATLLSASAASACPPFFFRPYYYPPVAVVPYSLAQPYYVVPQQAPAAAPAVRPPQVHVEPARPTEFARPEPAKPAPATPKQSTGTSSDTGVKPADFKATDSIPLAPPRPVTPDIKIDPPAGASPKADAPQLPAPGTDAVKIPPVVPPLKGVPDPTVPPLAIPALGPDPKSSTSKASPLADKPRVEVIPADGSVRDPLRRTVGFFNQSDRDVRLTVEGQSITLPRRHMVTASVPPTFGWKLDDGAEEKTTIPATAPGVEVVIRR